MPIRSEELAYVRDLVRKKSAIVIEEGKDYLIESRLTQVARTAGFEGVEAMLVHMKKGPVNGLHTQVVEAMTTNETLFFRDIHPFESLRDHIFPRFATARSVTRSLTIWSLACSTGQEPYSIAMSAKDYFSKTPGWNVKIVATDLAEKVLERARSGSYGQLEVNRGLPAPMLVKYFTRDGANFKVKPEIREMIDFRPLNLVEQWPVMPKPDIVFVRNVLIYFDIETKKKILARVRQALAPDGVLFLGGAETTLNLDDAFELVPEGKAVCYRLRK